MFFGKSIRLVVIGFTLGFAASFGLADSVLGACGDAARSTPLYKVLERCRNSRLGPNLEPLGNVSTQGAGGDRFACRVGSTTGIASAGHLDPQLCHDPNGYVCRQTGGSGSLLDSQCRFEVLDPWEVAFIPSVVDSQCQIESEQTQYLKQFLSKCPNLPEKDCLDYLRIQNVYQDQLQRIAIARVYTPERIRRVTEIFERVKIGMMQVLQSSRRIPNRYRAELVQKIQQIRLGLTAQDLQSPFFASCFDSTAEGLSTAVFGIFNPSRRGGQPLMICAGLMANLENLNPYELMWTIGHELGHAIDPCELERAAVFVNRRPRPHAAREFYPRLIECLRGGRDPHACSGARIHCGDPSYRQTYCSEIIASHLGREYLGSSMASCLRITNQMPSCHFEIAAQVIDSVGFNSASQFRSDGPQREQIGEAFSDFIGAAVTARLMREDASVGNFDLPGKRDALVSIASTLSRLHGVCLTDNTMDEHPPGYLRMNRAVMGSRDFVQAIGCDSSVASGGRGVEGGMQCGLQDF